MEQSMFNKIRMWANDRNLINGSTPERQILKLVEEMGELGGALARNNQDGVVDGIGDMIVVLTIIAAQRGVAIEDCIESAYNEIKDRKGMMVDGVFIKELDIFLE
jgi:NTP pyrophosphatase (non-canonical NTP hydrolase)